MFTREISIFFFRLSPVGKNQNICEWKWNYFVVELKEKFTFDEIYENKKLKFLERKNVII
jgi:hypothetical protein